MKNRRIFTVTLFLILFNMSCYLSGFTIEKIVILLNKVSNRLSTYRNDIEFFNKDFKSFYNKYWKNFNRKFFPRELKLLKTESVSDYYNSGYINPENKKEVWKDIFLNPSKLWKFYPYVMKTDHYKDLKLYKNNPNFRSIMDKNISDMKTYANLLEKAVRLVANTRKMQILRGKKVDKMKKQNDLMGRPKAYWEAKRVKLLSFGAMLEFEMDQQLTELLLLINMKNELTLKGELLMRNLSGRARIEGEKIIKDKRRMKK